MRKDEERRRKFHESLLKVLYPPPPSPPPHQGRDKEEPLIVLQDCLNLDGNSVPLQDELGLSGSSSSPSSVDEVEPGPQKLTRAQRKRLRKKKLKEAVSRRRKTIGPLLPNTPAEDKRHGDLRIEPQGVRPNVAEKFEVRKAISGKDVTDEFDVGNAIPGDMNQNKRKQRRMAKKLSRERSKPVVVNCHQDHDPCSNNETLT